MSDTHRTDDVAEWSGDELTYGERVTADFARQLERELAAALERVKRLEEAGDKLSWYATTRAREEWVKAKEAKP